jgi:hypothetical protein
LVILDELHGKETAIHKGVERGRRNGQGGEPLDELTRTKTEQTEEEEGVGGR